MAKISPARFQRRNSQWRESLKVVMKNPGDAEGAVKMNIGRKLQELRLSQGLSIRSLAEISGLNFNTLSLIENEKSSPNVNTLQLLANALQVPITIFFESTQISQDVVFQKFGQRPQTTFPHGNLEDLGGGLALGEATPLLMTANPNTNSGTGSIIHTGQEFVYCLEGNIVFLVGDEEYKLEKDDSLIFQAHIPHRWENRSQKLTKCLLMICPSDESDHLVAQHLIDNLKE